MFTFIKCLRKCQKTTVLWKYSHIMEAMTSISPRPTHTHYYHYISTKWWTNNLLSISLDARFLIHNIWWMIRFIGHVCFPHIWSFVWCFWVFLIFHSIFLNKNNEVSFIILILIWINTIEVVFMWVTRKQ